MYNIVDFGAIPNGKILSTEAFSQAISAASKVGGGTVYVPAGIYLTGTIYFKSNINLQLAPGAVILFSDDINDYDVVYSRWEGVEREVYSSCIYGADLENISITGFGTIDGQGEKWWKRHENNELKYPRPKLISFDNCNKVLIDGIKLTNSPSWTINPICCENVTINNVTIKNPANSPNTDGIDPDSCKNVHISNCHVDVGDDCIVIKSGTEDSIKRIPCENITITNCTMVHGHGGVVIGSEMSGGVRNVVISNCVFEGTDRGVRMKTRRGRGGFVEDIRINNIIMKEVLCPLVFHLYYFCGPGGDDKLTWDKAPYPIDAKTPFFRRIHISNITAREVRAAAGYLYGLTEMPLEDITFDNIDIHMSDVAEAARPAMMKGCEPMKYKGFYANNVKDISFTNVTISNQEGPAFTIENGVNIDFTKCKSKDARTEDELIVLNTHLIN
jgi:polygalacturonase